MTAKILGIPIAVFLIGILVPGIIGYLLLQRNADRETHEKAVALLATLEAVRAQAAQSPGAGPNGAAGPSAFTAEEAVLAVLRQLETTPSEITFRYRLVFSDAARSENRAGDLEAKMLATLQADPRLRSVEEDVQTPAGRTLVLAVPIYARQPGAEGAAKPPHARQANTPKPIIGAAIIHLSKEFSLAQASRIFWTVFTLVAMLSVACIVLLGWRMHVLVTRPANELLEVSRAIRRGDWGARFPQVGADEIGLLASSFQETTRWLRERVAHEEKLRALFQQFIPASVAAKALGRDAEKIIAGTRHPVTVMVVNIRNFKLLMEHLPPEETVTTLNQFFTQVNKTIQQHQGLVSKYLGDTVVAMFGMPVGDPKHALNAVKAALALPQSLRELYLRLDEEYGWQLGVGVGIATGEPIVGHFGSSVHMEYTVLGDVVVDAHNLEEISKGVPEEDTVLISETTYRACMSQVHVYDMGDRPVASGKTLRAFVVQGLRHEASSVISAA